MASRKEQKEKLRREREEREAQAKAAQRRKQLVGYGAGGLAVAVIVVVAVVLLAGGGGGGGGDEPDESVLPGGGSVPARKIEDLSPAARAAGCTLRSVRATSREHTEDIGEAIRYGTSPPTSGKHFAVPAEDGAYDKAPDVKELVHTLEHGRILVWFKPSLPEGQRATLKALFDEDSYQMVLTPDPTKMTYAVAATAWSREPLPNGTGRLLGCPRADDKSIDAIQAFRDEYRGNGPEAIP